jgi:aspartyl-tRNA(Asn)/glutamyl-tRNA(Gln) amidotransferase subunit B
VYKRQNVQRAIEFEIARQIEAVENGEKLAQETRSFDALKGITLSMRSKEAANDYRYFPEPDLLPLVVSQTQIDEIKAEMPALPRELFLKYVTDYHISEYDAYNITDNKAIALYYEALIQHTGNYKAAANWLMGDVKAHLNEFGIEMEQFPIPAEKMASLIQLIDDGKVSTSIASQKIFPELVNHPTKSPLTIAEELNVIQDSTEEGVMEFIHAVIEQHAGEVQRYRNGEKQLLGFLMGQLMKLSKGKADPKVANELMRQTLDS